MSETKELCENFCFAVITAKLRVVLDAFRDREGNNMVGNA